MEQAKTQTTFPLPAGTSIVRDQKYTSQSGAHYLVFQADGNLVVKTSSGDRVWGLDNVFPNFNNASRVEMQTDGNLAIYDASGGYLWSALTQTHDPRAQLMLTPRGALQLVTSGRRVLWSSNGDLTIEADPLQLGLLHADCESCREGLDGLSKTMSTNLATITSAGGGSGYWQNEVWNLFVKKTLPACKRVGDFIKGHHGELVLDPVEQAITDWAKKAKTEDKVAGWDVYFDGNHGISTHGSRIGNYSSASYDPNLGVQRIQKSISGVQTILDLLDKIEGLPDYGWAHCRTLETPQITIMGSKAVSSSAMDVVKHIYTEITKRFTSSYPLNKLDGHVIYMTNGEPWSELSSLDPVGRMWPADTNGVNLGDELRGGTGFDSLWIDEQMICKRGVRTRNEAYAAGKRPGRDDTERTFDQVIHEFGHAIYFRYGLRDKIMEVYKGGWSPVEQFPWNIQYWFGAPSGTLSESETAFMKEIFSSSTTFSRDLYKPEAS